MTAAKPKPDDLLKKLAEPFAGDVVKWRAQGKPYKRGDKWLARVVAYVDARIVIDRLNEVCGLNWQKRTTETPKGRVICSIGITLEDGREVWRDDGAGDTQIEGEKGAISDALKRAAVNFGVGAYLYTLPCPSVEVDVKESERGPQLLGLTRESKRGLAAACQRKLEEWNAELKAMDAGDEDDAPAAKQEAPPPKSTDDGKQGNGNGSTRAAPKGAALKKEEPEPKKPAKQSARVQTQANGNDKPGRHFEAPAERDADSWKAWSRQPLAAIKAASSRKEALGVLEANKLELEFFQRDTNTDGRAHLQGVIDKRFPEMDAEIMFVVKLPKTQTPATMQQWCHEVLAEVKRVAESMDEAEDVIKQNIHGLGIASELLKIDAEEKLRGYALAFIKEQIAKTKEAAR